MKVVVAGDFYPEGGVKALIDDKKYDAVLGDVPKIVRSADYSIVNYESPVVSGDLFPIPKCGPNLASSANGVDAVKWAGFKALSLANNHILDYGADGLHETLSVAQSMELDCVGVGDNVVAAGKVLYKEFDGKVLAIINCCEHEFSIATEGTCGAFPLDPVKQYHQILEARDKADFVLVIVHGGHEFFQLPSPRMVETYRFFAECGANAVVNHHQHCFSGYEIYKGCPIFYGIGNFCFERKGKENSVWNEGFLLTLTFEDGGVDFELNPYRQCDGNHKVELLNDCSDFERKITELNTIIADSQQLRRAVDEYYDSCAKGCQLSFEPYRSRITRGLFVRGLLPSLMKKKRNVLRNMIDCEAHRDKVLRFLKTN